MTIAVHPRVLRATHWRLALVNKMLTSRGLAITRVARITIRVNWSDTQARYRLDRRVAGSLDVGADPSFLV